MKKLVTLSTDIDADFLIDLIARLMKIKTDLPTMLDYGLRKEKRMDCTQMEEALFETANFLGMNELDQKSFEEQRLVCKESNDQPGIAGLLSMENIQGQRITVLLDGKLANSIQDIKEKTVTKTENEVVKIAVMLFMKDIMTISNISLQNFG